MLDNNSFKCRVAQVLSNEYRQDDIVPVCSTPELTRAVGFADCEIVMTQKHIRNCLALEDPSGKEHRHNLPIDFMDNLPRYIQSPAMILQSMSQPNSVVLVTDCKDKKNRPIIVALKNAGTGTVGGKVITCNIVTSTYGKDGFISFLNKSLQNNGLLYCDIKKSRDLVVSAGLQLPSLLANLDSMTIIRRYDENVNTFKRKFLLNPKNYAPEQYGQTLRRPDGLPFAYVDPDGRQRLTEYDTKEDGTPFVAKTTVTLSDGRTEKTEYNHYGNITLLERFAADGKETYSYYSDGLIRSHEKCVVSVGESKYSSSKSVHEKESEKRESRGYYNEHTKESWQEYDEHGNVTLSKHNVYGDGERLYNSSEVKYAYDRYGNVVSAIYDDGSVYKTEYYPPSEVRDWYGLEAEDYAMLELSVNDKVKTKTSRYPDGRINVKSYAIDGNYTESDYSPDGKLTEFRNENGETFRGKAVENAYLRSIGQVPSHAEVAANRSKALPQTSAKTNPAAKSGKGKPSGNGGRGSSGGSSGR